MALQTPAHVFHFRFHAFRRREFIGATIPVPLGLDFPSANNYTQDIRVRNISDNLSDLEFGELVWFAPGVSFELLLHCRGKIKPRALANCRSARADR